MFTNVYFQGRPLQGRPIVFPWDNSDTCLWEILSPVNPHGTLVPDGVIHHTVLLSPGSWLGEVNPIREAQLRYRTWMLRNFYN